MASHAIINKPSGGTSSSDTVYATRIDESGDLMYVGEAAVGSEEDDSVWRIKLIDSSSGTSVTWAGGVSTFSNRWDKHDTLDYS